MAAERKTRPIGVVKLGFVEAGRNKKQFFSVFINRDGLEV
jgi:hypothetical protein